MSSFGLLVKLEKRLPPGSVGLMANTWWCLAAMLPFAAYLNFCIVPAEEIYLRARFGSSYLDVEELDATLNFGVGNYLYIYIYNVCVWLSSESPEWMQSQTECHIDDRCDFEVF